MRLLVVGAGSTSAYLGVLLTKAGRDVTFLNRPKPAGQPRPDGRTVNNPYRNLFPAPRLLLADKLNQTFDTVIAPTGAQPTDHGSPPTSSMFPDMQERQAIGTDAIVGDLFDRGQPANHAPPLPAGAYTLTLLYPGKIATA